MNIGKILKIIFAVTVIALVLFVFIRVYMLNDTSELSTVSPTEGAVLAYNDEKEAGFKAHRLADELSTDGYYSAYGFVYIPSAKEVQLTARYNDSLTAKYLPGDENNFRWELRDKDGNTICTAKVFDRAEKYNYNYVRLIFENVNIGKETQLFLQLVCEECDYPDEGAKNYRVHTPDQKFSDYSLSADEKNLLNK